MPANVDMIIKGGTIVNQQGVGIGDLAIDQGRIIAIGDVSGFAAAETLDAKGLHILPGVIDSQVHFREPGAEHKEDLETGSRAAVLGGVTAVFEMPNTKPATTSAEALANKVQRATNRMFCDFAFYVGATRENVEQIASLESLPGSAGMKLFMGSSTGDLLVDQERDIANVLAHTRRRSAYHAEDEARLVERRHFQREGDAASHPLWRDEQAALGATTLLLKLAKRYGRRVHVLHVSTAQELPLLAANRDVASVEVTPHHLSLSSSDYARLGTNLQMNPPVRSLEHQAALWRAISSGLVDVLGSDHAPHTRGEKSKPYPASPSGMPGVQTLVPVMLDHVAHGRLTLERFVDLTAHGPARIFGLANKGRIAEGYDADFTIVDLKARREITNRWIASRCGWTPYDGKQVEGWPIGTFVRGTRVMWEDSIIAPAQGQPVRFQEALS